MNAKRETLSQKLLKMPFVANYGDFMTGTKLVTVSIAIRVPEAHLDTLKANSDTSEVWFAPYSQMVEKFIAENAEKLFADNGDKKLSALNAERSSMEITISTLQSAIDALPKEQQKALIPSLDSAKTKLAEILGKISEFEADRNRAKLAKATEKLAEKLQEKNPALIALLKAQLMQEEGEEEEFE